MTDAKKERPEVVKEEHLIYLDELRESGETNMFCATPYLISEFSLNSKDANIILAHWMKTLSERHSG